MAHIYREFREIPIPKEAKINHFNSEVSIYFKDGKNKRQHRVIGRAVSETMMHVNENFKNYYPEIWAAISGRRRVMPHEVHAGLYATTLSIGLMSNLYELMLASFGPLYANALMDWAMFNIRTNSNSAQCFAADMHGMMQFSLTPHSDSWYSDLFSHQIDSEDIAVFKEKWINQCAANGIKSVWLCIDGSNSDCTMQDSSCAEPGHAKSGNNVNIVSYIWAVSAEDGMPVTWFVNNGGMHDSKAFNQIINFIAYSNIDVEGVIIDRGFACSQVLDLVEKLGLKYIVKLKENSAGSQAVLEQYAADIWWKSNNLLFSCQDGAKYGIVGHAKIFNSSTKENCIALFFDGKNGPERSICLNRKIVREVVRLKKAISEGQDSINVKPELSELIKIHKGSRGKTEVFCEYEAVDKLVRSKGFSTIASSEELSADEIYVLYAKRDWSEKQFSILKSQLESGAVRVHSDAAMGSRLAAAFIAAIIRTYAMNACKELDIDTSKIFSKLDRVRIYRNPNDQYHAVYDISQELKKFLGKFNFLEEHLNELAHELNVINDKGPLSQERVLPGWKKEEPKPEPKEKRKRGRPVGSKNKSTLEREAREALEPPKPKRSPGRPKGSKNKKTLEREAALMQNQIKRGPGRPKGRKNNKTLEREAAAKKRGPGRPKGSGKKAPAK